MAAFCTFHMQRYPTATITERPPEADTAAAAAAAATMEEEETAVEGEDFLSPMAEYAGGENYMANVAQVSYEATTLKWMVVLLNYV